MAKADKLGFESDKVDHPIDELSIPVLVLSINFKRSAIAYCSEQIFMICSGLFYKFLHPVQEFRLKIDTLKMSHLIYVYMEVLPSIEWDLLLVLRFEVLVCIC